MIDDVRKLFGQDLPIQATERKSAIKHFRPYKGIIVPYNINKQTEDFEPYVYDERKQMYVRVVIPELNFLVVKARFIPDLYTQNELHGSNHKHIEPVLGQLVIVIAYTDEYWIAIPHELHSSDNNLHPFEHIEATSPTYTLKPTFVNPLVKNRVSLLYTDISHQNIQINSKTGSIETGAVYTKPKYAKKNKITRQDILERPLFTYENLLRCYRFFDSYMLNTTIDSIAKKTYGTEAIAEYYLPSQYIQPIVVFSPVSEGVSYQQEDFFVDKLRYEPSQYSKYREAFVERLKQIHKTNQYVPATTYKTNTILHNCLLKSMSLFAKTETNKSHADTEVTYALATNVPSLTIEPTMRRIYDSITGYHTSQASYNEFYLPETTTVYTDRLTRISNTRTRLVVNAKQPDKAIYTEYSTEHTTFKLSRPLRLWAESSTVCDLPVQLVLTKDQIYRFGKHKANTEALDYRQFALTLYRGKKDLKPNKEDFALEQVYQTITTRAYSVNSKNILATGIQRYITTKYKDKKTGKIDRTKWVGYTGTVYKHAKVLTPEQSNSVYGLYYGNQLFKNGHIYLLDTDEWHLTYRRGGIVDRSGYCRTKSDTYAHHYTTYVADLESWRFCVLTEVRHCDGGGHEQGAFVYCIDATEYGIGEWIIAKGNKYWAINQGIKHEMLLDTYQAVPEATFATIQLTAGQVIKIDVRDKDQAYGQIELKPGTIKITAKSKTGKKVSVVLDANSETVYMANEYGSVSVTKDAIHIKHDQAIHIEAPYVAIGPDIYTRTVNADTLNGYKTGCDCGSAAGSSPSAAKNSPVDVKEPKHASPFKQKFVVTMNPEEIDTEAEQAD